MNIAGKFSRVSSTDYRDGVVLVGFLGNVFPHDLNPAQIEYVKGFYNMGHCAHQIYNEWPGGIEPCNSAAKSNFPNGYLLLTKGEEKCD